MIQLILSLVLFFIGYCLSCLFKHKKKKSEEINHQRDGTTDYSVIRSEEHEVIVKVEVVPTRKITDVDNTKEILEQYNKEKSLEAMRTVSVSNPLIIRKDTPPRHSTVIGFHHNLPIAEPLSYDELLKTQEWQDKRYAILKRDNYCCSWCGKQNDLNVHHQYYSKHPNGKKVLPWDYPDDALITLCRECHRKAHNRRIKVYWRKYTDFYY